MFQVYDQLYIAPPDRLNSCGNAFGPDGALYALPPEAGMRFTAAAVALTDIAALINDFTVAENGVMVFASSTGNQDSIELPEARNGAFTKALEGIGDGRASFGTSRITPSTHL
jgi:hypothetical protein